MYDKIHYKKKKKCPLGALPGEADVSSVLEALCLSSCWGVAGIAWSEVGTPHW